MQDNSNINTEEGEAMLIKCKGDPQNINLKNEAVIFVFYGGIIDEKTYEEYFFWRA